MSCEEIICRGNYLPAPWLTADSSLHSVVCQGLLFLTPKLLQTCKGWLQHATWGSVSASSLTKGMVGSLIPGLPAAEGPLQSSLPRAEVRAPRAALCPLQINQPRSCGNCLISRSCSREARAQLSPLAPAEAFAHRCSRRRGAEVRGWEDSSYGREGL